MFSHFLRNLAQDPACNVHVPLLILDNGTSCKFNRVFEGIKLFFQKTPKAQVHYHHVGIQSPSAAQKGLGWLGEVYRINDAPRAPSVLPDPIQDLAQEIVHLTRDEEVDGSREDAITPTFSETDSDDTKSLEEEVLVHKTKTHHPEELLQKIVQFEEIERQCQDLRHRWEELGGREWPPLGIRNSQQIVAFHLDELPRVMARMTSDSPLMVQINGLWRGGVEEVVNLCWSLPSIWCVSIQDSSCSAALFKQFWQPQPQNSEEESDETEGMLGETSILLNPKRIRFLDLTTALDYREIPFATLPDYFSRQQQGLFLNHLVWIPKNHPLLQTLDPKIQRTHQLFRICLGLELLQSEFPSSLASAAD